MDPRTYTQDPSLETTSYISNICRHNRIFNGRWSVPVEIIKLCSLFYNDRDEWEELNECTDLEIVGPNNEFIKRKKNTNHFSYRCAFGQAQIGRLQRKTWKFKICRVNKRHNNHSHIKNNAIFGVINSKIADMIKLSGGTGFEDFTCNLFGGYGVSSDGWRWHNQGTAGYSSVLAKNDIIEMELNSDHNGFYLRYYVNGIDKGKAFTKIPFKDKYFRDIDYQMAVCMQDDFTIKLMQ